MPMPSRSNLNLSWSEKNIFQLLEFCKEEKLKEEPTVLSRWLRKLREITFARCGVISDTAVREVCLTCISHFLAIGDYGEYWISYNRLVDVFSCCSKQIVESTIVTMAILKLVIFGTFKVEEIHFIHRNKMTFKQLDLLLVSYSTGNFIKVCEIAYDLGNPDRFNKVSHFCTFPLIRSSSINSPLIKLSDNI